MGLLSTEVEIRLEAQNINYYESLGYTIPRYYNETSRKYKVKQGTTLMVKIQDLPKGSHMFVDLICDGCGKELKRTYYDYNKRNYDGKVYCFHCAHKILNSGENNCNWNPNLTDDERIKFRKYPEYIQFTKNVLERDNYTCQCCGRTNTYELDVHHLYAYASFPQYRIDQTQAVTLCKNCHKDFHSWYIKKFGYENKGKCTRDDYEQWINYALSTDYYLCTVKQVYDYESDVIYNNVEDCAKKFDVNQNTIYRCCNNAENTIRKKSKNKNIKIHKNLKHTVKGHHLFWLDVYNSLTENEISNYLSDKPKSKSKIKNYHSRIKNPKSICKKVICLTTGEIFEKNKRWF